MSIRTGTKHKDEEQTGETRDWLSMCGRLRCVTPELREIVFEQCPKCQGEGRHCIVEQAATIADDAQNV